MTWQEIPWGFLAGQLVALLITLWLTRDREHSRALKRRLSMPDYAEGGYISPAPTGSIPRGLHPDRPAEATPRLGHRVRGYWWAEYDPDSDIPPYRWRPALETEEGMIFDFEVWFETKEECEAWIEKYIIGRELRRD